MSVTVEHWGPEIGARLELVWTAALAFSTLGLILLVAIFVTLLIRR